MMEAPVCLSSRFDFMNLSDRTCLHLGSSCVCLLIAAVGVAEFTALAGSDQWCLIASIHPVLLGYFEIPRIFPVSTVADFVLGYLHSL